MGMHFYDWRNITLLIDGVKVTGWWEGDDVLGFKRIADSVTTGVGVDGEMFVSLNADKRVSERSKMECRVDGGSLFMSIDATDAVALRSALNGQLRVIDSCLSCLDVK